MNTDKEEETLALTPAQNVFVFRRDCVRGPREREKLASSPGKAHHSVTFPSAAIARTLPMNPPLERDRSPVAAAPTACLCRNPPQVADCIRTRCAPGRRALRTLAGSRAQGAIKVRSVLSWGRGKG